ncbi:response regulator transcription factor [Clostridium sp. YIM B02515]|uniref:Stage 0 sporulation protein A homolog n=1 Tax=Clostridium rhizosphaerae TaxID=2803861 RepID=A0ABS1TEX6_9CLOT|nr:response regulator transcription factor [Clostridium rhizosphaerae]MBL4936518.1 response regulator transcription factor [Clostridium rhizosphaerae]
MEKIKIVIVDDEKLIRQGLKIILNTYSDIEVVGEGENGEEALKLCKENDVDLVLMDIRMPVCDGVIGTKLIKDSFNNIKILILTTFKDDKYIHDALNYGASGYLLKDSDYDVIYEGIKAACKGSIVVHPEIATNIMHNYKAEDKEDYSKIIKQHGLSEKDINIIREIANGLTNKEIGDKLYLTEGTIKNNISVILSKLGLRDRTQIVIFAFKNGIAN